MYYRKYCKIKEELIRDIKFYAGLIEEPEERDCYDSYASIHYEQCYEGIPDGYIVLDVMQYRKDYVLAYTNNDELIRFYNGKQWKWDDIDISDNIPNTLCYVGNYIVKVPYENIILKDLFLIANELYDNLKDENNSNSMRGAIRIAHSNLFSGNDILEELLDDRILVPRED